VKAFLMLADRMELISVRIGQTAAWAGIAMMGVILADVILRRWFVIGSTQLQELEWHLHGVLFLFCLGFAYARGEHVRIELFRDHWSDRTKAIIEVLGGLFILLPFAFAVIKFGFDYTSLSWSYSERSATGTGLGARWLIKGAMVAGFVLLVLPVLSGMIRSVIWLVSGDTEARRSMHAIISDDSNTV